MGVDVSNPERPKCWITFLLIFSPELVSVFPSHDSLLELLLSFFRSTTPILCILGYYAQADSAERAVRKATITNPSGTLPVALHCFLMDGLRWVPLISPEPFGELLSSSVLSKVRQNWMTPSCWRT